MLQISFSSIRSTWRQWYLCPEFLAGRGGTAPTKNGINTLRCPPRPPAKIVSPPQIPRYQVKTDILFCFLEPSKTCFRIS